MWDDSDFWIYLELAIYLIPFVCLGLMIISWIFGLIMLGAWSTLVGVVILFFIIALKGNGSTTGY